jgi:hypothetical protein
MTNCKVCNNQFQAKSIRVTTCSPECRFLSSVFKDPDTGCWNWTAGVNRSGYGSFSYNGIGYAAHRFGYSTIHGEPPKGFVVRHKCDNPRCCNPQHLEAGTQSQNIKDISIRGSSRGRPAGSRLTLEEILAIYNAKGTYHEIAESFSVSQNTVYRIQSGENHADKTNHPNPALRVKKKKSHQGQA